MLCAVALHELLKKQMQTESSLWRRVYCVGFATIIGVLWDRFAVRANGGRQITRRDGIGAEARLRLRQSPLFLVLTLFSCFR